MDHHWISGASGISTLSLLDVISLVPRRHPAHILLLNNVILKVIYTGVWDRDDPHVINLQLVTVVLMNIDIVLRDQVQKNLSLKFIANSLIITS